MKFRLMIVEICIVFVLVALAQGQFKYALTEQQKDVQLTGFLQHDLALNAGGDLLVDSASVKRTVIKKVRYSPLTAGLLSAVVPGAGQFYTKSYWQSASFLGAEVLVWIAYAMYERQGNQRTDAFQQFADAHWSVAQYATWMNINYGQAININPDQSLQSWLRVNWNDLNNAEGNIEKLADAQGTPNTGFTHHLAPYGDQQYYEMIGKYSQFGGGWDDARTYTKTDVLANNGIGNVSPRFIEYSHMRGNANSSYNIATTVSYLIVANHVFSALEAAFNAASINHKIQLEAHIQSRRVFDTVVEFVQTLQVKYEL